MGMDGRGINLLTLLSAPAVAVVVDDAAVLIIMT
jgi:hypothetical protein